MVLNTCSTLLATLVVGKIPKAPGTWGSLLAALIWWFLQPISIPVQISLIVIAFFIGWLAAHHYEAWTHRHDAKEIVVDELVGMWITLLGFQFLPLFKESPWVNVVLGFLFFRLFDIWKPFPVGKIDRDVPGALGTMLDDVVAGVMAWLLLYCVNRLGLGYF